MKTATLMKRVDIAYKLSNTDFGWDFNCWGTTLFILSQEKKLMWCDEFDITEFLLDKCKRVREAQVGDIMALYEHGDIIHTAVCIGPDIWFHKPGREKTEYQSKEDIVNSYSVGPRGIRLWRMDPKKIKEFKDLNKYIRKIDRVIKGKAIKGLNLTAALKLKSEIVGAKIKGFKMDFRLHNAFQHLCYTIDNYTDREEENLVASNYQYE